MAKTKKTKWALDPDTLLDIVATREGYDPIVKEMTYKQWMEFTLKRGWNYTAYQKGFQSFSYQFKINNNLDIK